MILERAGFSNEEALSSILKAISLAVANGQNVASDVELIDTSSRTVIERYEVKGNAGSLSLGKSGGPSKPIKVRVPDLLYPFVARVELGQPAAP